MSHDPQYDVPCPMPGCDEPLGIEMDSWYGLTPKDVTEPGAVAQGDVHSTTWKVACQNGHVILLPDDARCCDDPEGDDCTHDQGEYDHSDDTRDFHRRDMLRLVDLIAALAAEVQEGEQR